jgi:hypothetical protein
MIVEIPIFDGGLITNVDPEDIPKTASSDTENFDVDVKGKLVKRKGLESKGTLTGSHLSQLFYWSDPNLTNNAIWVSYETQNDQIVTFAVNNNGSFGTKTALATLSSSPSDIQIIPMANSLRFANGKGEDVGFLQYIDRKFFFHNNTQGWSYDDLKYDDASPTYPTTWELEHVETVTGKMALGTYYYKVVPVFDGVQEVQFEDQFIKNELSEDDKGTHFTLKIDEDDYNPRITGANVYRHFSEDDSIQPVYRLIKSINLATKDTSDDIDTGHDSANMGRAVYFPNGGVTTVIDSLTSIAEGASSSPNYEIKLVAGSTTYILKNDENSGTTASYTDNLITLNTDLPSDQDWWNETITLTVTYDEQGESSPQNTNGNIANGYGGRDVIYDGRSSGYWDFSIGEKNDWVVQVGSQRLTILESIKRVIKINADSTTLGTGQTIGTLSNGYYYEYLSNNEIKLHIMDTNGTNDRTHRLSTTKNKVNYTSGTFSNGRFFAGNVRLDPDDEAEDHSDFIIFSPINQPDILPISNYIQIKDTQGGDIVAMRTLNDNIIVFMERGVHQIYAPSSNPSSFSLRESEANVGCVSANSIVEAGQVIFFAGNDNIYMTGAGRSAIPVSTAIKDTYQGATDLSSTIGVYDPLRNRVLFRFGSDGENIYALDYQRILSGEESWNKITFASAKSVDKMSIDANLNVYITHNES